MEESTIMEEINTMEKINENAGFMKSVLLNGGILRTIFSTLYNKFTVDYSLIYGGTIVAKINDKIDGKRYFKKVFYYRIPRDPYKYELAMATVEKNIATILKKNPHPNIVEIYEVTDEYVRMELLDTSVEPKVNCGLREIMLGVKNYLQGLGIMYIDWKPDNIGISRGNGAYKLFDFDVSGIVDLETGEWTHRPVKFYSYNLAIKNGCVGPKEIDDYSFDVAFSTDYANA
jgi:serine/threonine protein kinase